MLERLVIYLRGKHRLTNDIAAIEDEWAAAEQSHHFRWIRQIARVRGGASRVLLPRQIGVGL
jgi:hypothetical protein